MRSRSIEHVESISGQVPGASGDHQFRIYVRLIPDALDTLARSQEFKRGVDNTVFHKGYPTNYRAQGGTPSIQVSIAPDGHRADIDVDYRSSSFPAAMFNGHLSSANSDVRAGDNVDRHSRRWAGLQNWWRSFFGVNLQRAPADEKPSVLALPSAPRAGKKNIDVMANDFLSAWLVEGDVVAAMGYVSERAYACIAQNADDPSAVDRGMAPFQLLTNLKAAHDTLGQRTSLDGLIVGVRLATPALKVVQQPHHAQFVLYSVPDDVAAAFDCESRLTPGGAKKPAREYGNYFGSTFFVDGHANQRVALLWGKDNGYWKIVSWRTGVDDARPPVVADNVTLTRVKADAGFAAAAQAFLQTWLIKKDYDAAFGYLSPASYACYDLARNPADPAATSPEDAGRKIRAGLERAGQLAGPARNLDAILVSAEPIHPAVRVMDHAHSRTFSLTSIPNAIGDAVECDARARGADPSRSPAARVRKGVRPDRSIRPAPVTRQCCECCGAMRTARGESGVTTSSCRSHRSRLGTLCCLIVATVPPNAPGWVALAAGFAACAAPLRRHHATVTAARPRGAESSRADRREAAPARGRRVRRRQRPRHRPRRRHSLARGTSHPHRRRGRHEHGWARRRRVCHGHGRR